jgi:tRNA (cmo5U34)-methyltransferase
MESEFVTNFESSFWNEPEFVTEYLDNVEAYVPYRRLMLSLLASFYKRFFADGTPKRVLDLGCGDGIVAQVVAGQDANAVITLVDGSAAMLEKAALRFAGRGGVELVEASFQNLVRGDPLEGRFDLVISSLAIHHLPANEKRKIYSYIFKKLSAGGYLLHADVVLGAAPYMEEWAMELWKWWVDMWKEAGHTEQDFSDITRRYQEDEDNRPDTLAFHLDTLQQIGFDPVDTVFRYGPFAIWWGRKS